MAIYGNYVVQTAPLPEDEIKPVLALNAKQSLESVGRTDLQVFYTLNVPFEEYDEETGETVRGFKSSWSA